MFERNYACDRWIYSYFRLIDLNETGADALQRQLYFCMFGQALYMKAQVEGWRSNNIWGLLTWQYNEVWPTGGWGSIEYGSPVRTNAAVNPCTLLLYALTKRLVNRWLARALAGDGSHYNTFWRPRRSQT